MQLSDLIIGNKITDPHDVKERGVYILSINYDARPTSVWVYIIDGISNGEAISNEGVYINNINDPRFTLVTNHVNSIKVTLLGSMFDLHRANIGCVRDMLMPLLPAFAIRLSPPRKLFIYE